MKAGFKPKTFTRKEWEDNRSAAAKGSGVGKALDAWKDKCSFDMQAITVKEIAEAYTAATNLDKALDVALKKCDPKAQKETIAGIGAYKDVVASYLKTLKATNSAKVKRNAVSKDLSLDTVLADKDLLVAFTDFAKKKAYIFEPLHTLLLWKAKKYEDAVKLYGKGNDYNVSNATNKILLDAFAGKDRGNVDLKSLERAIKNVPTEMTTMLNDTRHYKGSSAFENYPAFLAVLDKKFPVTDFST
jgi:hypothetical protein